jgi:hypothetical protein
VSLGLQASPSGVLYFSYWIDYLGFITEGKLTAIFIKTFSWGFQLADYFTSSTNAIKLSSIIITAPPTSFLAPLPGKKKSSARGVSHAHPLLRFKFCFTLFLLASFYQKHTKISILYSCYFITSSSLCCSLSTFWRTSQ